MAEEKKITLFLFDFFYKRENSLINCDTVAILRKDAN